MFNTAPAGMSKIERVEAGRSTSYLAVGVIFLISRVALLWYNEAEFTDAYEFIQWSLWVPSKRHPLYPMLLHLLSPILDPIIAGRIISALAGLLGLFYLVKLTKRLYGTYAALICSLLFTVSPHILFVNTRVLTESLYLAVMIAAIHYFLSSLDDPKRGNFFLLVLFSAFAALTRPEGIMMVPLILVAAISIVRRGAWKALLHAAPALIPWIFYSVWSRSLTNSGYESELAFSLRSGTTAKFFNYLFDYIDVYPYSMFYPVFILALLGLTNTNGDASRAWRKTLIYFHIVMFAVIAIHQAWSPRFLVLPMTLLLVEAAHALSNFREKLSSRTGNTITFAVITCSLIFASLALYFQRETYADIKESAIFLRDHAKQYSIYSDETIKVPYYAQLPVFPYIPDASYKVGDIITLHSFHTPVVAEFRRLTGRYQLEVLFTSESRIIPLLANTLLEHQLTNLPIAMAQRFREQKFYSAVAKIRSVKSVSASSVKNGLD